MSRTSHTDKVSRMAGDDMKKTFQLPLVPGTTCGEELLRRNYRRAQLFGHKHEKSAKSDAIPIDYSSTLGVSRSINGSNSPLKGGQRSNLGTHASGSMTAAQQSGNAPADLERQVLRFFGFFRESVAESNVERERIRKITIQYFLEDHTLSVSEPRQDNAGMPQGTMVKRHVVPTPSGEGSITFNMLNVGETVSFYGRTYYLVDADAFTRGFLESIGCEVPEAIPYPDDAHTALRTRPAKTNTVRSIASTYTSGQARAAKQFFDNDGNVLRCDAIWDDTKALHGTLHRLVLYYFLADNTIQVVEKASANDGKDPFPSFIKRQKINKPKGNKFENLNCSLTFQGKDAGNTYYTEEDLVIGNTLSLFGRNIKIIDYDQHTRDHLRLNLGVTDYTPQAEQYKVLPKAKVVHTPPPHNGFGSEEDSLSTWNKLEGKAPRKDDTKFNQYGNSVVKFSVKLDNGIVTDEARRFVLSCFLADDTVAVFEPVQRNSGMVGGKFLQRQKVRNPATGKNYVPSDFFVGASVVMNSFHFKVLATDERSMSYMEQNSSSFPKSNINSIAHKIQAMLMSSQTGLGDAFYTADKDGNGALDYKEMVAMMRDLGLELSEQEVLTVLRYFDRNGDAYISYEEFVSRMMPEGSTIGQDDRDWKTIHSEMVNEEHDKLSTHDKVALQKAKVETTTAAYGARAFMEAYNNRRALFHQEFKFICDYSWDEKISEKEFRTCVVDKLHLDLNDAQVDALCAKLFPSGARRVTYEEFIRLINSNSNRDYNLKQIRDRRM